jgi:hypothetical protein
MLYMQSIEVWRKEEIVELLNKFFPKFTYNSNKIGNKVEAVFKRWDSYRF